jgi:hypothetical protein
MTEIIRDNNREILRVSDKESYSELKCENGNLYLTVKKIKLQDGD